MSLSTFSRSNYILVILYEENRFKILSSQVGLPLKKIFLCCINDSFIFNKKYELMYRVPSCFEIQNNNFLFSCSFFSEALIFLYFRNGCATSEDLFWKLDALQSFIRDLHWPDEEFRIQLEQRLKLMAFDMIESCVQRCVIFLFRHSSCVLQYANNVTGSH